MDDIKKTTEAVKKLEVEFLAFQKIMVEFITNDFHHLALDVASLVKQNTAMRQDMQSMEKKILEALGARGYDYVHPEKND